MGESAFLRITSLLSPEPMVPGSWVLFFFRRGGEEGTEGAGFTWNMEEAAAWTESERGRQWIKAEETVSVELAMPCDALRWLEMA